MSNVTILKTSIRENNGLFSLNDLHIASGGESKHRPNQFLRLDQTKELIAEMENENQPRNTILVVKNGMGSYACEELVLSYAMWISPKFHLVV
ncbi:KilA-N domain-containing protein, partial [Avibacterium paragallinarum]